MTRGRGGSHGGPPVLQVVREVNAAAAATGTPPPIDADQVLGGIDPYEQARAFPQCRTCTLPLREPGEAEQEAGGGTRSKAPRGAPPLPGARAVHRLMCELWFADYSRRAIKQAADAEAVALGWPEGEVPSDRAIGEHFARHMPVQAVMARRAAEAASRLQGAEAVADGLTTLEAVVERAMRGVASYVGSDYRITSPLEMIAVARWAEGAADRIADRGDARRQEAAVAEVLMELRRMLPAAQWSELAARFRARADGPPASAWEAAEGEPAGEEFSGRRALPAPDDPGVARARELAERFRDPGG